MRSSVSEISKAKILTDGEGRGTGRLVLILKPMPSRVTAEWMAQQWRDGRRTKSKIGSYPAMSLSEAREIFKRDFAEVILKGKSIKIAGDARPGTVADLFEAYVAESQSSRTNPPGQRQKQASKGRRRPRTQPARHAISLPMMSLGSSGPSMSVASARWPITFAATFDPPTPGASSRSTTIAALAPPFQTGQQSGRWHSHRAEGGRHPLAR